MTQRTKLIVSLILVACALTLILATPEKATGTTLLLAVAGGWGLPPSGRRAQRTAHRGTSAQHTAHRA